MGLLDILSAFKKVKEFILENAPAALDRLEEILGQMGEAVHDASDWLKSLEDKMVTMTKEALKEKEEFSKFQDELHQLAHKSTAQIVKMRQGGDETDMPAGLQLSLIKVLSSACDQIASKLDDCYEEDENKG